MIVVSCLTWMILTSAAYGADPIFKTCQDSEFCSRLRYNYESSGYTAQELGGNFTSWTFSLSSNEIQNLILTISFLKNSFRITIDELAPSSRFHLNGVLDGIPKASMFEKTIFDGNIVFSCDDNLVVVFSYPFKLEFYKKKRLIAIANAKYRMAVETKEPNVAIALDIMFPGAKKAYGIPAHAEHLALRTTTTDNTDPYRLFNVDILQHSLESTEALYGSVPVLYAHGYQTAGVFWHNGAETWVDIENNDAYVNTYFMSESGVLDFFLLTGPTPQDVVRQYASLTGTAPLPQYFTLAYHQCRRNYASQGDVQTVVAEFDYHDLPLDSIWLDINHTDNNKYFTWDPKTFPVPLDMQANLTATNRKLVTIIGPHVKKEPGYFVYDQALAQDLFVRNADGRVFEGDSWPGVSSYLDFLNPNAQSFYADLYSFEVFNGSTENTYIWNDMNEPSVFDDFTERTFPKEVLHFGNVEHRDLHNLYGFLQTKATYQGLMKRSKNNKRPFVLTRSHFAGSQRYATVWTGHNTADWNYLAASFSMCLTEALAGISFCGADVGGFYYDPSVELLQRWYQAGAWLPFYRAHAQFDTKRREPYLFPVDVQARIRAALRQRYAHLPLWYTLFWEHSLYGDPVIRPLFYSYPNDSEVFDIDTQILVGTSVMVTVVDKPHVTAIAIYFPGGKSERWYDAINFTIERGTGLAVIGVTLDKIPVHYRGGSIIFRKDTPRPTSVETHGDPYSLYVFPNDYGFAEGTLYIDDTESFNYQNGEYNYIRLTAENNTLKMIWQDQKARYLVKAQVDRLIIADPPDNIKTITITKEGIAKNTISVSRKTNYLEATELDLDLLDCFEITWQ